MLNYLPPTVVMSHNFYPDHDQFQPSNVDELLFNKTPYPIIVIYFQSRF